MRAIPRIPVVVVLASLLLAAVVTAQSEETQEGPPPPPPLREIPGLTAEDPHPNGCVDCHVVLTQPPMDVRISTLLAQWNEKVEPKLLAAAKAAAADPEKITGRHPKAAGALKNIPGGCLMCHGKDSKNAPPFARMIHLIHLTGGSENPYMTYYQGDCTHCHKLDTRTGTWRIPSGPEP